jgi:hypothetical protein
MVTQVLQSPALIGLRREETDQTIQFLTMRMLDSLRPLMSAQSPRVLRRMIDKIVLDYLPFKMLASAKLFKPALEKGKTGSEFMSELVGEVWQGLGSKSSDIFTDSDRRIITEVMKMQAEIVLLADQTSPENVPALYSAVADAFWSIQKIDVATMAVGAIQYGELTPQHEKIVHWLCLALRQYVKEWQSALFSNNPVLQERLSRPLDELKTISLDELEEELGL